MDDHLYRERGIHITTLRHPMGFEWMMFDEPKQKPSSLERRARLGVPPYGNGWPGIRVRWCTGQLKTHLISKAVKLLREEMERTVNNSADRLKWTQHFKEFSAMTELDRRSVITLIEAIEVIDKENLRIRFRYKLEYEAALKLLTERKVAPLPLLALHPALAATIKEAV